MTDSPSFRHHHLLIVIPGMGARSSDDKQVLPKQIPFSEWFSTRHCCSQLQSCMENELKLIQKYSQQFKCPLPHSHFGQHDDMMFQVGSIDYSSSVRSEHGMDKLLGMVTPKTGVPYLRQVANQTCIDVLAYVSSETISAQVRQVVTREANRIYHEFCEKKRKLGDQQQQVVKVSIVAHSLGTVVAYDLLKQMENVQQEEQEERMNTLSSTDEQSHQQRESNGQNGYKMLDFQVDNLFLLGSPLGLFLAMREGAKNMSGDVVNSNLIPTQSNQLLLNSKVYHIYHPYDPVAYRIEPLLDSRMADINSVVLAALDLKKMLQQKATELGTIKPSDLEMKWNSLLNDMYNGVQSVQSQFSFKSSSEDAVKKNQIDQILSEFGERIDYVLPADTVLNEYLVSTEVHLKYWMSPVIAHFIIQKLGFLQ